ncbi:2-oxoglutarate dehydrogenase E1 component [Blattabacterium cuenoti]|uniref:2-oxoglutarate dehydrogenase E1 component n=1 Tax=Blattabacterium cuenoti TaxID=1653831 RepID=UPI00163B7629|nr:2-oxoglutarate dehydrogenase E1 component [Blattabacterium cuenoti]
MTDNYSFLNAIYIEHIEFLYKKYMKNPQSVESSWMYFFHGFNFGKENYNTLYNKKNYSFLKNVKIDDHVKKELLVYHLIQFFRYKGHFFAKNNPIENQNRNFPDLNNFNLSHQDLDRFFESGKSIGIKKNSLKNIIFYLKNIYCGTIGIEYPNILCFENIQWIEKWFQNKKQFSTKEKKNFLKKLNHSILFENFIHNKFIGQKRFSIEGNESILPALSDMIEYASIEYNTEIFVVGMSHRGRLNVLFNLFQKDCSHIFNEFQGKEYKEQNISGDVKYHLGYSKIIENINRKSVTIHLVPNPSHLESVNPIVEGIVRAKIDIHYYNNKNKYQKVIPIIIHGDAAISGQGIVYEVLQLSQLNGYKTGGTIHIVINNQIGFTTSCIEGRSSLYCTDVAKVTSSPVLHVNANDVESVVRSIRFAIDFRMRYNKDIFIDLIGYRKYGHNEGDEPKFSHPILYKIISKFSNSYELYKKKLQENGDINEKEIHNIENEYQHILNKGYQKSQYTKWNILNSFLEKNWTNFPIVSNDENIFQKVNTKFSKSDIIKISNKIFRLPEKKKFFKKITSIFQNRLRMIENNLVDWSMAELLAYGTLLFEGFHIRLSGEDVSRGTFSQRHIIVKTENEEKILLLNKIGKGKIQVFNSPLSEYGVLGFDYGYAMVSPNVLTLWEAQFGDFVNGGQIIIDQYISSGEDKWKIRNGIVLLLPHGYEGQGPEHSSARIERYLQLCAKNNQFLANCTSPSNFYHLLRRHMKLNFRKPLIIFTPKSLLRNKKCLSTIDDLSKGFFQEIIDDPNITYKDEIKKLIFCSGKIYYDLLDKRRHIQDKQTAIIRIEQIYPLKIKEIHDIILRYKNKKKILWIQEEPENMGLWSYILRKIGRSLPIDLVSPCENSSPSTGSYINFLKIQNQILQKAFI